MNRNSLPFTSIVVVLICIFFSCNGIDDIALHGEWIGEYSDSEVYIRFEKNQNFYMTLKDSALGQIETISGKYRFDNTKRPIPITIYNISQLNHPLHAILEMVDEDSIRISIFSNRQRLRPICFSAESTINLIRK